MKDGHLSRPNAISIVVKNWMYITCSFDKYQIKKISNEYFVFVL